MRTLIVVCRYLGDTLMATPLARSLAAAGHEVDWLVAPGTEAMVREQAFAHAVHVLEPNVSATWNMLRRLRGRYDIACVTTPSDRPMLVAFAAAKQVFTLDYARTQDGWKRKISKASCRYDGESHMASYAFDLARMAGAPACRDVGIDWTEEDTAQVQTRLNWNSGSRFVHVHPFARWSYKHWPQEQWQTLIGRLLDAGLNIAVTAGPGEKVAAETLAKEMPTERIRILAGELSWPQLASLSHQAVGYIGLDTANTHLAAGTGTPTLSLFGPTDPRLWGPWPNGFAGRSPYRRSAPGGIQRQGNITLIQREFGCVPCQLEGCDRHRLSRSACMDTLAVDQVWREASAFVQAPRD
jgi:lipopolysaccharide heptosyltransferase III